MRLFIGEFVLFVSLLVLVLFLFQVSFILVYRSVRVWVKDRSEWIGWQILLMLWSCCQSGLVDLVLLGTLRLCISHILIVLSQLGSGILAWLFLSFALRSLRRQLLSLVVVSFSSLLLYPSCLFRFLLVFLCRIFQLVFLALL